MLAEFKVQVGIIIHEYAESMYWKFDVPAQNKHFFKIRPTGVNQVGCIGTLLTDDTNDLGDIFLISPCPDDKENLHTNFATVHHPLYQPVKASEVAIANLPKLPRLDVEWDDTRVLDERGMELRL